MIRAAVIGGTNCLDGRFMLTPPDCDFEVLIVNYTSCDLLLNSALGMNTPIINAIKSNKPVYIIKNNMEYKKIKNIPLYNLYFSYCRRLMEYGVKFVSDTSNIKRNNTKW